MNGKRAIKKAERNTPVKKSIRVVKVKKAPTAAEDSEPMFDGSEDFYDRHHAWSLRVGHGYGGKS